MPQFRFVVIPFLGREGLTREPRHLFQSPSALNRARHERQRAGKIAETEDCLPPKKLP
jgi:hypothetical protein